MRSGRRLELDGAGTAGDEELVFTNLRNQGTSRRWGRGGFSRIRASATRAARPAGRVVGYDGARRCRPGGAGAKTTGTASCGPEVDDGAPRPKIERGIRLARLLFESLDFALEVEPRHFAHD